MNDEKHQIWGTFSVKDHTRPGAFIADVIMYDRLVIPVPPSRLRDAEEAKAEWGRWEENKWDPAKQTQLLGILGDLAVPVEWNKKWREKWEKEAASDRTETSNQIARDLFAITGGVLLEAVPAMAMGAVAVTPYDSLDTLKAALGIRKDRLTGEDLERGGHLPGHFLAAIIGREFLVPEDPDKDDFQLLADAVRVATNGDYREARAQLHRSLNKFLNSAGETDVASIDAAIKDFQRCTDAMRRANVWNNIKSGSRHSLFVGQTAMKVATLTPVVLAQTLLSVGNYLINDVFASPGKREPKPQGALFVDAQQKLGLPKKGERVSAPWERIVTKLESD